MSVSTLPTWVVGLLQPTSDQEKVSTRPGWRWRTTEEEHKTTRDRRRYSVQRAFAKHQKHAGESYPGPLSYFCAHRHDRQVTVFPSNLRTRNVPPELAWATRASSNHRRVIALLPPLSLRLGQWQCGVAELYHRSVQVDWPAQVTVSMQHIHLTCYVCRPTHTSSPR